MTARADRHLFALCVCALLQACSMPTWGLHPQNVTKGSPPPITPVAIGKHTRALAFSCSAFGMRIHVEPSEAVLGTEARARCVQPDTQPGPWLPARVTPPREEWLYTDVDFHTLDCDRAAGKPPPRLEVELPACVRDGCEVLRFDYSAAEAQSMAEWPAPQ